MSHWPKMGQFRHKKISADSTPASGNEVDAPFPFLPLRTAGNLGCYNETNVRGLTDGEKAGRLAPQDLKNTTEYSRLSFRFMCSCVQTEKACYPSQRPRTGAVQQDSKLPGSACCAPAGKLQHHWHLCQQRLGGGPDSRPIWQRIRRPKKDL